MKEPKRTKKDDADYVANLKREESIKTEVIVELRNQNHALWQTQRSLLKALIDAETALMVYRQSALDTADTVFTHYDHGHSCVPGCTRHHWDDKDGWHRTDDAKETLMMVALLTGSDITWTLLTPEVIYSVIWLVLGALALGLYLLGRACWRWWMP